MFKSKFIIYLMDASFNILNCFDDRINNLDITKYYIYVLQLVDDRYYIGRTGNILRRIEDHFTGVGSIYTIKYKPIKVIEVTEELSKQDERNKTLEVMSKYGWKKVRGACWCSLEINKPKEKYNNTLDRTDLSVLDYLQHAKEEAMDLALYLEKTIQMLKGKK